MRKKGPASTVIHILSGQGKGTWERGSPILAEEGPQGVLGHFSSTHHHADGAHLSPGTGTASPVKSNEQSKP